MASKVHPKFDIDYEWQLGDTGWNVEMDNNLRDLALFCQATAEGITDTPPGTPVNGETHIVGQTPTGIFAGKTNQIAIYLDSAWAYYIPKQGYIFYNKSDDLIYRYTGAAWTVYAPAGSGDMTMAVYDTNSSGVVDEAEKVSGVESSGNGKYYGTDSQGNAGYHDLPEGLGAQSIGASTDVDVTTTVPVLNDILRFNGTNWVPVEVEANNVRLAFSFVGQLQDAETLAVYQVVDAITLPTGLTGSSCYAGSVSTGAAAVDIQKNGASIGTVDFTAGNNTAAFTFSSEVSFVAGDRLSLIAPPTADATLGDISLTLLADL